MATTTKRKVKPLEEAMEVKALESVEEKVTYPECLSEADLRILEVVSRDVEMARLTMHVEEQALRNMVLEYKLLEQKADKQRALIVQKSTEYANQKNKYAQIKAEIWPRYGLQDKDGLGYDDQSGRIIKQTT